MVGGPTRGTSGTALRGLPPRRLVEFDADDYARLIRLPGYAAARVVADPRHGFGQPIFVHGGARVEDVLGAFQAGVPLKTVAAEYGVPASELEDALRVASRLPG